MRSLPLAVILIFCFSQVTSAKEKNVSPAPSLMPGVSAEMNTPDFWIDRHPDPDVMILNTDGIRAFNHGLSAAGLTKDLLGFDAFDLKVSLERMLAELKKFETGKYFDKDGQPVAPGIFQKIRQNLDPENYATAEPRFAFVIRSSDQRLLPTLDPLTVEPLDLAFDEVQNSLLDAGEPAVVLFQTLDGLWVYVHTAASAGWVRKDRLEFVSRDEFKRLTRDDEFVVVTAAGADLYLDPERKNLYDRVHMGAVFAVNHISDDTVEVFLAPRITVFIEKKDVAEGFLKYSPRNVITQAFKLLESPYGWGGLFGAQDCSAFIKSIFAVFGFVLPRNSGEQGRAGREVADFKSAFPGISIAQMKGHIVLYLGMAGDRPFVIHQVYAYREPHPSGEMTRVINRAVVSDMKLGEGSRRGSLLERVVAIREYR